jgi:outer membrane protein assembly factor BamB
LECQSEPFLYDGILYIAVNGSFNAIDPSTGEDIWKYAIPGKATLPVFYEDMLIFGGHYIDNYIYALNKDTGKEIWTYYTGIYAASVKRPPVIHNDLIYALAGKSIHCISLMGKKQWTFNLKKKIGNANLVLDSDRIFAVTDEGVDKQVIHCVDIAKKELLWRIKAPYLGSNLLKIQDQLYYLNRDAELCQVNTVTEEVTKTKVIQKNNRSQNLHLSYHDGIIVIVVDYTLLALNIATSSWSWKWNFKSSGFIGHPVIADNSIYFATCWNGVYGLDFYTGKELFHKKSDVRSEYACGIFESNIVVAGSMNEHELTAYEEQKLNSWSIGNILKL